MYYGDSLFTTINLSFCSWVRSVLFEFLRPEEKRRAFRGVLRPITKSVKFSTRLEGQ